MNLLVTNTHAPQAYAVVRALRPHAARIVATVEGTGPRASVAAHAARSRLVDRRCPVPSPAADWAAGRISRENTPAEARYVEALERICREEHIDAIYPSWDPHVYVLAKNRERFAAQGVVVPVPDLDVVLTALDKHLTVLLAREAGFPCPATRLYDGPGGLASAAEDLGFPMVVKPRFTSGGRGMAIVRDRRELAERAPAVAAEHGPPLLQEYIPGGDRGSVQLVLGRDGKVLFAFHKARRRKLRLTARYGTVSESAAPDGPAGRTAGLVARLGWWGAIGVETIHDPRDGVDKLMEINPRFPRQLWNRTALGINEPWMCLRLARGEEVAAVEGYPLGVLFVSPVEDAMLLAFQVLDRAAYRLRCAAGRPLDPASAAPPVVELLRSFAATYRGRRRRLIDPYSRFFLQDPATSLSWWLQFSTWVFGGWRHLGR